MKKCFLGIAALAALMLTSQLAYADLTGAISTDRFGYTGSTTRFATLQDAIDQVNPMQTITIGNRDLSLYSANGLGGGAPDANIIMGAWWYSTDPNGQAGWGNNRGNTGIGFLQIYEYPDGVPSTSLTRTSTSYKFGDFNGTHWTSFTFSTSGVNASGATSFSRFSPFTSNTADGGTYLEYALTLTATGLEGALNLDGDLIEATGQPTGVTGTFTGLFQNTGSDPDKVGFYRFSLDLDMENWAWENRDDLTYPVSGFSPSYFAQAIPEPTSGMMILLGLGSIALFRRRQR
jgi:hypothetical protein